MAVPSVRRNVVSSIIKEAESQLGKSAEVKITFPLNSLGLNAKVDVGLDEIRRSQTRLPLRPGMGGGPTVTGYTQEGMFEELVRKKICLKKLKRKRQLDGLSDEIVKILFVDTGKLRYMNHGFNHPWYFRHFQEIILKHVPHYAIGEDLVDIIVFCSIGSDRKFQLIYSKNSIYLDLLNQLFNSLRELVIVSEGQNGMIIREKSNNES